MNTVCEKCGAQGIITFDSRLVAAFKCPKCGAEWSTLKPKQGGK
ncbi:MAG: hypothetical protein ABFC57_12715 [Veillonellales bacterium]